MTPAELSRTVLHSVRGAVAERELSVPVPARIVVQPPPRPGCGDYASNVALQLAKQAGRPAREVAEILCRRLAGSAGIARVEIAGPGFLNFHLGDGASAGLVREVLARGERYGEPAASGAAAGAGPGRIAEGPARCAGEWAAARESVVREVLVRLGRDDVRAGTPAAPGRAELAGLVARLGADEARWALLKPAAADPVRPPARPVQHEDNPRFRVQYAHARSRAMVRNAGELGFTGEPGDVRDAAGHGDARLVQALESCLATYPTAVATAARSCAPDRLVRHLEATADAALRWQEEFPPLPAGEQKPSAVHRARVALAEATGTVLCNGLHLLGISSPEHV
ncbi:ArgS-related anticodon-binding protein NrtL [Streptomyces sp. NPDC020883]|uniref:ArgS-related anticodon-binding protein NrtL n=1 Tax=unclassified Streptomyces TaxID=2593676 RepID=UPI003319FBF4